MATLRTIVGVDGSSRALDAVRWAVRDAELHASELVIVAAWAPPARIRPAITRTQLRAVEGEVDSEQILADAATVATASARVPGSVTVTTESVERAPIPALIELSGSARMTVVGSRGLSAIPRGLLGSVSSALCTNATGPVTVVHDWPVSASRRDRKPVVVGTDCSAAGHPALELAFDEADVRGVELTVVHAWSDTDLGVGYPNRQSASLWSSGRDDAEDRVTRMMTDLVAQHPDVRTRLAVIRDRPAQALLDHAQAAQLLVVGSHGRGGFAGMLQGSVSRTVAYRAECPITVVRPRGEDQGHSHRGGSTGATR